MLYELLLEYSGELWGRTLAQKRRFGHRKCENRRANMEHHGGCVWGAPGLSGVLLGAPGLSWLLLVGPGCSWDAPGGTFSGAEKSLK